MSFASLLLAATVSVNFNSDIGKFRPELHSSSYGPTIAGCSQKTIDEIKEMGFKSARTHDWALANSNQRVCDYHHIFPIIHLDATNPSNYVFAATDYLLKRAKMSERIFSSALAFRLNTRDLRFTLTLLSLKTSIRSPRYSPVP